MSTLSWNWLVGLLTLACSGAIAGQVQPQEIAKDFVKAGSFSVPDSPAAAVLGSNAAPLSRPQSARHFAFELLQLGDGNKKSQGLSVAFAPALLIGGRSLTLQNYRSNPWEQRYANTELSFGFTDPEDGSGSARRASVGLAHTLFDTGDPRLDKELDACISAIYQDVLQTVPPPPKPGDAPDWAKAFETRQSDFARCTKASAERQRFSDSLKFGVAKAWGDTPSGGGWQSGGYAFWLAGAYSPGGSAAKSPLRVFYRVQQARLHEWSTETSVWKTARSRDLTLQLRYDLQDADVILEVAARRLAGNSHTGKQLSLGFEKNIAEGMWFVASVTARSAGAGAKSDTLVLGKFKFAFSKDPYLMNALK